MINNFQIILLFFAMAILFIAVIIIDIKVKGLQKMICLYMLWKGHPIVWNYFFGRGKNDVYQTLKEMDLTGMDSDVIDILSNIKTNLLEELDQENGEEKD